MSTLPCSLNVVVLVYGDFGEDTQHIGCFNPACDVLTIAKGVLYLTPYQIHKYLQQGAIRQLIPWLLMGKLSRLMCELKLSGNRVT